MRISLSGYLIGRNKRVGRYPYQMPSGYIVVAKTRDNKNLMEHHVVAARAMGKVLPPGTEVHHRNEAKDDNRPVNLIICESREYHMLLHRRALALRETGDANKIRCVRCHRWDDKANVVLDGARYRYVHRGCRWKRKAEVLVERGA